MTKKIKLEAMKRTEQNGEAAGIRNKGFLPAVVYGPDMENLHIKVNTVKFEKTFNVAGESNLIDLTVDDADPIKVVVKDIQRQPVRGTITHVDFYRVNMKKPIHVAIPLYFVGEAPAEKELGGTLIKNISELEVKCLPGDLIEHIEIDVSTLKTFDDAIRVSDLSIPKELEVQVDENEMVASVLAPVVEEEEPAAAEEESEGGAKAEAKEDGAPAETEKGEK